MSQTTSESPLFRWLEAVGVIKRSGHFAYTSGRHGSMYVNKDAIYPHAEMTSDLCLQIAKHFAEQEIDVVIAPAVGGVILSQWVAYHLSRLKGRQILGLYAEKGATPAGEGFVLRRGYADLCRGKRALVVEDILNTGGSVKKLVTAVKELDAQVVGVAALCNRGGVTSDQVGGVPEVFSLLHLDLESWSPEECPLCKDRIPIHSSIGKGSN